MNVELIHLLPRLLVISLTVAAFIGTLILESSFQVALQVDSLARIFHIPCMVRWTLKGIINSEILADALAHTDSYNVYKRKNDWFPFLFVDGHQSWFEIPFLEYITDKEHKWQVCIGVKYGTSLWQVADSKEQNGSYKIALARTKIEFFENKLSLFIDPYLV